MTASNGGPPVVNIAYETVALDQLQLHERNPNQGDVGAIMSSLDAHGFYGAVVAQRSTGKVLAGNHRLIAAREAGMTAIPTVWVDVDDETAVRILLADNRTTRLGLDDNAKLAELLSELTDTDRGLFGTGFDGDDLDDLLGMLAAPDLDQLAEQVGEPTAEDFWPVVRVKVRPDVYSAWQDVVAAHQEDEAAAFASLLGM